jgi:hypothetical protein
MSLSSDEMESGIKQASAFGNNLFSVLTDLNGGLTSLRKSSANLEDEVVDLKDVLKNTRMRLEKLAIEFKTANEQAARSANDMKYSKPVRVSSPEPDGEPDAEPNDEPDQSKVVSDVKPTKDGELEAGAAGRDDTSKSTGATAVAKKIKSKGWGKLTKDLSKYRDLSKETLNKNVLDVGRKLRHAIFECGELIGDTNDPAEKVNAVKSLCQTIAESMENSLSHVQLVNETSQKQLSSLEGFLETQKTQVNELNDRIVALETTTYNHTNMLQQVNAKLDYIFFGKVDKQEESINDMKTYLKNGQISERSGTFDYGDDFVKNCRDGGLLGRFHLVEHRTMEAHPVDIRTLQTDQQRIEDLHKDTVGHIADIATEIRSHIKHEIERVESKFTPKTPYMLASEDTHQAWLRVLGDVNFGLKFVSRQLKKDSIIIDWEDKLEDDTANDVDGQTSQEIKGITLAELPQSYPNHCHVYTLLSRMLDIKQAIQEILVYFSPTTRETELSALDILVPHLRILVGHAEGLLNLENVVIETDENGVVKKNNNIAWKLSDVPCEDRTANILHYFHHAVRKSYTILNMAIELAKLDVRVEKLEKGEEIKKLTTILNNLETTTNDALGKRPTFDHVNHNLDKKASQSDLSQLREALFGQLSGLREAQNSMVTKTIANSSSSNYGEINDSKADGRVDGKTLERFDLIVKHFDDMKAQVSSFINRDEVEEAMTSLVKEVRELKAHGVDRSTFNALMQRKADQRDLVELVAGLKETIANLRDKNREVQINEIEGTGYRGNNSGTHTAAIMAARCLVCDKLVDDDESYSIRPSTQPSRRKANRSVASGGSRSGVRSRSPVPRLGFEGSMSTTSFESFGTLDQREFTIMSQTLDLPPISDTSRAISIQSGAQSQAADPNILNSSNPAVQKNTKRIRGSAGGGVARRQVQNTR